MFKDINNTLIIHHENLLLISYRIPRSQDDLITKLTTLRKIIKIKNIDNIQVNDNNNKEKKNIDDLIDYITASFNIDVGAKAGRLDMQEIPDEDSVEVDLTLLQKAAVLIGKDKLERLNKWARLITPTSRRALYEIIELFPLLGIKPELIQQYSELFQEIQSGRLNASKIYQRMNQLVIQNEEMYTLLQILLDLMKSWSRLTLLCRLPTHHTIGQMRAHQKAVSEIFDYHGDDNIALKNCFDFLFCSVCFSIYSILRDVKSQVKRVFRYGYRDANLDLDTDELYCENERINHIGRCSDQPLIRLSLFGVCIRFNKKTIKLCGECGMPMVHYSDLSDFGSNGSICFLCSKKHAGPRALAIQRLNDIKKIEKKCVQCECELKHPFSTYMYPFDVYMCSRHNSPRLINAVDEWMDDDIGEKNKQTLMKFIVANIKEVKKINNERNEGKWKRKMAMSKLARSNRR